MEIGIKSKGELAAMYMPNVAVPVARAFLISCIKKNKQLKKELEEAGYTSRAKLLTPKQIRIIFRHIGEP